MADRALELVGTGDRKQLACYTSLKSLFANVSYGPDVILYALSFYVLSSTLSLPANILAEERRCANYETNYPLGVPGLISLFGADKLLASTQTTREP
jgi:hypothetical protein